MTTRRRRLLALAMVPLLAAGVAACGDDDDEPAASGSASEEASEPHAEVDEGGDNVLHVEQVDYGYDISGSLSEGWTTIEAENTGDEYHMMGFGRMKEGVTLDDVRDALASQGPGGGEEPPADGEGAEEGRDEQSLGTIRLASQEDEPADESPADEAPAGEEEGGDPFAELFEGEIGAPGHVLAPGASVSITTEALVAGDYAVICFIPTPEGEPHFARGMINEFTVEAADEPAGEEPEADYDVSFGGGEVSGLDGEPAAGETTFSLTGEGSNHEFAVARADDENVTFEQLDEYFAAFEEGAPPTRENLEDGPGILDLYLFDYPPGQKIYVTVDLEAGSYFLGCDYEGDSGEGHEEFVQALVT